MGIKDGIYRFHSWFVHFTQVRKKRIIPSQFNKIGYEGLGRQVGIYTCIGYNPWYHQGAKRTAEWSAELKIKISN